MHRATPDEWAAFGPPDNINRPVDTSLTSRQSLQFSAITEPMMQRLFYADAPEYAVKILTKYRNNCS
jgi:hypothetical protein